MSAALMFVSRYRRGLILAPSSGCLAAPVMFAPGWALSKSIAVGLLVAVFSVIATTALAHALRRLRPALSLSAAGVRIDGLAPLSWNDIISVRRDPDSRGPNQLLVRLRRPLEQLPSAHGARVTPLWSPLGADTLVLRTALLEDPTPAIEEAFRHFLGR